MRKPAEWMIPACDRVLETLRDAGTVALATGDISHHLEQNMGDPWSGASIRRALNRLVEYGLVDRLEEGKRPYYRITDLGLEYLNEELDARELEPVGE
jgi:DNA-binding transcriptional regulator PaaX